MANPTHAKRISYGRWNESTRIYEVEGNRLPSVTSVIGMADKPALVNWAARLAAEYSQEHREALGMLEPEAAVDAIKGSWRRSRDKAANFGTAVHEAIEVGSWDPESDLAPYCQAALDYLEAENMDVVGQEITVVSMEHGYAGTMDVLALSDGVVGNIKEGLDDQQTVVDWKSGKGLYDSAAMQLTALMNADHMLTDDGSLVPWDGAELGSAVRLKASGGYQSEQISRETALGLRTYDAFLGLIPVWYYKTEAEVWA